MADIDEDFLRKLQLWSSQMNLTDSDYSADGDEKLQGLLDGTRDYKRLDGRHILIIVLGIIAIVTNLITLLAIKHIRRRISANQTMMCSLCCSDLLTAAAMLGRVTNQQLFDMNRVGLEQQAAAACVYKLIQALVMTGHISTLCNLLCLAVDHYCAIARPLTYSIYMSKSRVHIILTICWVLSVLFGFSDLVLPSKMHGYCEAQAAENYCWRVYCSEYEPDHLMFCVVIVCLAVMTAMYGGIMCILYQYQQQQFATPTQQKAKRHIRGLITSFIILGLFAILWLPNCILDAYVILKMRASQTLEEKSRVNKLHGDVFWYLYALVILNAVCDPIIYAMRMREIQDGLKRLLCFKRPTFADKMRRFGDDQKQNSNGSIPLKYVQRQFSNSTNTTMCSGMTMPSSNSTNSTIQERKAYSRNGTVVSMTSEEEVLLQRQSSLTQNDTDLDDHL